MYPFMIPQTPAGIIPLPMTFRKTQSPKESPKITMPQPTKQLRVPEISESGSSTRSFLGPGDDEGDTASTIYEASVASSLGDLTKVEPRIFLDIVDDAIPVHTEYRKPEPPPRDGTPDSAHGLGFGAEVMPEPHHRRRRSHSAVPVSFADREPGMTDSAADPTQVTWSRNTHGSLQDHGSYRGGSHTMDARDLRVENERSRAYSTSVLSAKNDLETYPAQIAQWDMDRSPYAKIGALTPEEMRPDLVGTSETQSAAATPSRPKKGLLSKFKQLIKPHGKDEEVPVDENEDFERRDKDKKKSPSTGMNMLAHTMGYGMGRF